MPILRLAFLAFGASAFGGAFFGRAIMIVLGLCALGTVVGWIDGGPTLNMTPHMTSSGLSMTMTNPGEKTVEVYATRLVCEWKGPVYRGGTLIGVHKVKARFYSDSLPTSVRAGKTKTVLYQMPATDLWPNLTGTEVAKCELTHDFPPDFAVRMGETWTSRADHCTENCPPFLIGRQS
jgi:hypothetical protein